MTTRSLQRLIPSVATSDGAGVKIKRSLGQNQHSRLDPFLMLDFFGSDKAGDYIKGFPPHPHRGFETVTYMLEGHMLHEDHLGNQGHLKSGGVQWMTAGRGIIHSEMPQQEQGLMQGFQLWLNLPAAEKMKPAAYVDIAPEQIPTLVLPQGHIKVIAGTVQTAEAKQGGPIQGLSTAPQYYDVALNADQRLTLALPAGHTAFVYPYQGDVQVIDSNEPRRVPEHHAGVLSQGDSLTLHSTAPCRLLVLAGAAINEPVVQYGPFVMNSVAEIEQALRDYQNGTLTDNKAAGSIVLSH
ncbi:pirin family protein [Rheinheimera nanhaiensis]|uniref:Pirin-like protein PA3240 n=1 Tax=Rheinheimera nanhaiensis E407-8 TaxID=562729 RepID=I1E293_9GAMM|nr:pirin family protein [Rheinheimera nanhaiensis]GAB60421.1 pirin-like protein PA3240 [Rheinheimera nanhaiensis E407-8]